MLASGGWKRTMSSFYDVIWTRSEHVQNKKKRILKFYFTMLPFYFVMVTILKYTTRYKLNSPLIDWIPYIGQFQVKIEVKFIFSSFKTIFHAFKTSFIRIKTNFKTGFHAFKNYFIPTRPFPAKIKKLFSF